MRAFEAPLIFKPRFWEIGCLLQHTRPGVRSTYEVFSGIVQYSTCRLGTYLTFYARRAASPVIRVTVGLHAGGAIWHQKSTVDRCVVSRHYDTHFLKTNLGEFIAGKASRLPPPIGDLSCNNKKGSSQERGFLNVCFGPLLGLKRWTPSCDNACRPANETWLLLKRSAMHFGGKPRPGKA